MNIALSDHIHKVVRRAKAFYAKQEPGHFIIRTHFPVKTPCIPPLLNFDLDRQLEEWLTFRLEAIKPVWRAKEGLDDDVIPSTCPYFGIAEHSAWLGLEVVLQEDTCLPKPIVNTVEALDKLRLSEATPWFGYMKRGYDFLRSRKDGTFLLAVRGTESPMDLANALRGDDLFMDFLLQPDFAHRLMEFSLKALEWYYPRLLGWADSVEGGNVFAFGSGGWWPLRTLGHLSNDAALLCSKEVYEEFGFPYEVRFIEKYNHAIYHTHNQKLHFIPKLASLPRLAMLQISHDPKTPRPLTDLPRIFEATGSVNLNLIADSDEVRTHINQIKERNVFLEVSCRDKKDAEDIIAFVRSHSKPL